MIKEYKPIPSVPICLVIIILNIKPRNLDKNPPVRRINVPKKNSFLSAWFYYLFMVKLTRFLRSLSLETALERF